MDYRKGLDLIEKRFQNGLGQLFNRPLPPGSQDPWEQLAQFTWDPAVIAKASNQLAHRMVSWVNVGELATWREASARAQRSRMLYRLLQKELQGPVGIRLAELTRSNAALIRSLPAEVTGQLAREIQKAQQIGTRPETITKALRTRFPEVTQSRIRLIARTQVSRASTELTQARSEELDLPWFIWRTSEDQRVRPSHRKMDGVVAAWSDLPSPEALAGEKSTLGRYAPGACPNCRCIPLPILNFNDAFKGSETRRVYGNGSLQRMNLAQFRKLNAVAPTMREDAA